MSVPPDHPSHAAVAVAGRLAGALDADDFAAARELIAADCVYEVRGETLRGREHRHRCVQHVEVGADGLVSRIVHEDYAGEQQSVEAFLAARAGAGEERA